MTQNEFLNIAKLLRVYKDCISTADAQFAWYESLREYSYHDIDNAVRSYINDCPYTPTPANIIQRLPKANRGEKIQPKYETINGKIVKLIQCKRCQDTGLVTTTYRDGSIHGTPCDCPAGHQNFAWGWLDRAEQEAFIGKYGHHGEIIGESWYPT